MNKVTLLLLFVTVLEVRSQTVVNTEIKKWELGFVFSPDFCYRSLKNNSDSDYIDNFIEHRNENESAKLGLTTGFNICYHLNNKFGVEGGLQYSIKGYSTNWLMTRTASPDPSLPVSSRAKYNYHYLDIPIKTNVTFGENRLKFTASAGMIASFFIKEMQVMINNYSDGSRKSSNTRTYLYDYRSAYLSATLSGGIDYAINDKIHFKAEPTFRYGITSIIDAPIKGYLWSVGLNMGSYIRL